MGGQVDEIEDRRSHADTGSHDLVVIEWIPQRGRGVAVDVQSSDAIYVLGPAVNPAVPTRVNDAQILDHEMELVLAI